MGEGGSREERGQSNLFRQKHDWSLDSAVDIQVEVMIQYTPSSRQCGGLLRFPGPRLGRGKGDGLGRDPISFR